MSDLRLEVPGTGEVSAVLVRPAKEAALLVLAHGAGADMRHRFMESLAAQLSLVGIGTLRFQFPYTEAGKRRPDPRPVLLRTVAAAVEAGRREAGDLPVLTGGKSMGGRMTSLLAAEAGLPGVAGLVFFGFPLHPAGEPSAERGEHLARVVLPMLFLQGTRDTLADLSLLTPLCRDLGPRARLHVIEGADHSFHVPRSSGRSDDEVMAELAAETGDFARRLGR